MVDTPRDADLPKIITSMEDFDKQYDEAQEYAVRFKCSDPITPSPTNKKRKSKSE